MKILRTPDECFDDLPGFSFAPHYTEIDGEEAGGLRVATDIHERFASITASNTGLPACSDTPPGDAAKIWFAFCEEHYPDMPIEQVIPMGVVNPLGDDVLAAYRAPFPSVAFRAGPVAFPRSVPFASNDPAAVGVRRARERLARWDKPFLTLFSDADPLNSGTEGEWQSSVPGAAGQPHEVLSGGHYIQEDNGEVLARKTIAWLRSQGAIAA